MNPVVVVGGGWSGLAAAVELTARGLPVTLLEAARQLGGRARRVPFDGLCIDNGQHLLLGAYRETLGLLGRLGVAESDAFLRQPLSLRLVRRGRPEVHLRSPPGLPAPLHLVWGLLQCAGLSAGERLRALGLCLHLLRTGFRLPGDIPVARWLTSRGQPAAVIEALWAPLCLAALNTPPSQASTRVFLRVLQDTFARRRSDSDMLLPRMDLGAVLPDPAMAFIERRGGSVRFSTRVTGLRIHQQRVRGVRTAGGEIAAEHVILAVPPVPARRLLKPHSDLLPIAERLGAMIHEPTCTVFLRYPAQTSLGSPLLGLVGHTAQWVFDRALNGQPGLMAVVISGSGPHMELGLAALARQVQAELAALFPHWPAPLGQRVICERRATFACRPDAQALRPAHRTPVDGLWLAGDHMDTGYPATLEGAVRSGLQCAQHILENTA